VVECLPSKCEALEFKPSITTHTKKKKKKKERKKKKKLIGLYKDLESAVPQSGGSEHLSKCTLGNLLRHTWVWGSVLCELFLAASSVVNCPEIAQTLGFCVFGSFKVNVPNYERR
jgi:hypothetical protein